MKTQFESLNKEFDAVRKKFGVPLNAGAGGRGGGGGGAAPRRIRRTSWRATSTLKTQLAGVWEVAERGVGAGSTTR